MDGRAALVTASSRGLGRASAAALVAEGARVAICGRHPGSLSEAAEELRARGGEVLDLVADVTEASAPGHLVAETVARFGGLDVVVANAGGPPPGRALEIDDDQVRAAVEANLLSSVRLVREAVPHMRAGGWGRICCIASASVVQPVPALALSNLARTGLRAWVRTAAAELAGDGITLNLACPGSHSTDRMVQLGGTGAMGDPEDFGKVVAFLCSAPAGYVNGATVVVDGGATVAL